MKTRSEYVIIGGGALGAAMAYYLSKKGKEVVILEKDEICSGTSAGTVAWIGPMYRNPRYMQELSIKALTDMFLLERQLDRPFEFTMTGSLQPLYTEEQITRAEKAVEMAKLVGHDVMRIVTPEEGYEIEPAMRGNGMVCACYEPYSAHINPFLLVNSFIQTARRLGAELNTFTEVTGFVTEGRRITAVETNRGTIECEHVICCAGLWSYEIGKMLGLDPHVHPNRGCCLVSEKMPPILRTYANSAHQATHGNIIFGLNNEDLPVDFRDTAMQPEGLEKAAAMAVRDFPCLKDVNIIRSYVGLRCKPDDGLPIIGGDYSKWENFDFYLMHSAYSFTAAVSPMAAAVFAGERETPEIEAFSYNRFLQ